MIAALFVETNGCYFGLPNVDPWDEARDARLYEGPHPVVSHSPCQRWGRYWGGHPRQMPRLIMGDDKGCFESSLSSLRKWGGIGEHPEGSHAWARFNLNRPPRKGGWVPADMEGGWTCCVEQGHYGHLSRKLTWLIAYGVDLPELIWGPSPQRLHPRAVEIHGVEKATRIGVMAWLSSSDPRRNATPHPFRDLLISIAESANQNRAAA